MVQLGQIKRIKNDNGNTAYIPIASKKHDLTTHQFKHDNNLRNCIALLMRKCEVEKVEFSGSPDATVWIGGVPHYIEYDSGRQNRAAFREKIEDNYSKDEKCRVIFFMATLYAEDRERPRLGKIFEVSAETLQGKKGRIIGCCYTQFLKDSMAPMKLPEECSVTYDLQYHDFLKERGLNEDVCNFMGVGVPKGKSMLAGCIAFKVHNEKGKHIAFSGVRMKDGKSIFHHSFNPELSLYSFHGIVDYFDREVVMTTDIFQCVRNWQENRQSCCNYGLPYLSPTQISLLNQCKMVCLQVEEHQLRDFAIEAAKTFETHYRFEVFQKPEIKKAA